MKIILLKGYPRLNAPIVDVTIDSNNRYSYSAGDTVWIAIYKKMQYVDYRAIMADIVDGGTYTGTHIILRSIRNKEGIHV
jgi:hypothetical protein